MRTLTLGLLVASGGILAALPFRRYPAIGNASLRQVTGPAESPLDATHASDTWSIDPAITSPLQIVTTSAPAPPASAERPWPTQITPAAPRRRRPDVPLSLADLAQPIDQPMVIDQRFNATTKVHEEHLERERQQLVMPSIESLDATERDALQHASSAVPRQTTRASLASTFRREAMIEPIPQSAPAQRERHWIRQPE